MEIKKREYSTTNKEYSYDYYDLPTSRLRIAHGVYEAYAIKSGKKAVKGFFRHDVIVGLVLTLA